MKFLQKSEVIQLALAMLSYILHFLLILISFLFFCVEFYSFESQVKIFVSISLANIEKSPSHMSKEIKLTVCLGLFHAICNDTQETKETY